MLPPNDVRNHYSAYCEGGLVKKVYHGGLPKTQEISDFQWRGGSKPRFWNNELVIGPHLYRMVGVTKYSPGHFYRDVYDQVSKNWLHLNTMAKKKKDVAQGFTLKPVLVKKRRVLHIEGLIKDVNCVHYVRKQ